MVVTRQDIKHLGWLSRIELSESELETYATQIEQIVGYLDILDSVPITQQDHHAVKKGYADLRADSIEEFGQDPLGAVYRKDGFVKGPRMVS